MGYIGVSLCPIIRVPDRVNVNLNNGIPTKLREHSLAAGRPNPLGATFDGQGVNFAVFSEHAEAIDLCLFTDDGRKERARIPLLERDGDIWHVYVGGVTPGTKYGFRVQGPYDPENGHRFNYNKLLLDPYTKRIAGRLKWSDAVMGYRVGSPKADLSFDTRDSAFAMPRSMVVDPSFNWGDDKPPAISASDTLLYEAHVKGMTARMPGVSPMTRGRFLGMASEPVLEHLTKIGVTTVQLMPAQAYVDDHFLAKQGLKNYWGYNSIGFFAPEPRYMTDQGIWEFQTMVRRFHAAGIEVVLDVVYNHTAEGNEMGPTLSFKGFDNLSYYRLAEDKRFYVNDTGTGNTLRVEHPMVLRMIMDSMRYWVEVMHVDGFRFDLATILAREESGFDRQGGFLDALRQDPVLGNVKLIAEPWDLGPGGYQLGNWPHPFLEFNDKYRDNVRKYWRGDSGIVADLAKRVAGSAEQFDHSGRAATSSINFVTVHDGFVLDDLVSYNVKHNAANGEDNRDGKDDNYSDNMGVEGPTDDEKIRAARALRKRNLLATVFLSQGTPMLLSGDEIGNSQWGNNNTYAQDNDQGWVNWNKPDHKLLAFVEKLADLRRAHPVLRQSRFLHSRARRTDGKPDLFWRMPDGRAPSAEDWQNPNWRSLSVEVRTSSDTPEYAASNDVLFLTFNAGDEVTVKMPDLPPDCLWELVLDTAAPEDGPQCITGTSAKIAAQSVCVFAQTPA
ncbi:glycogen debranching protein GlgX [Loktanella salsilacus]|uniref:glycogen debranching protein GlgX n=1 Tax=Loktanella salsilacus TaxID=195913 RepID=UPI0020B8A98A|nr:glycogen debranching protein GlgX [Loktanella salsilacus]UTH44058.1 glycogen debranching protein GlgX [Loktanella salsilacus]UTH47767.1 glycogen debranching protein GlgX [Loktanella salsilacus]